MKENVDNSILHLFQELQYSRPFLTSEIGKIMKEFENENVSFCYEVLISWRELMGSHLKKYWYQVGFIITHTSEFSQVLIYS